MKLHLPHSLRTALLCAFSLVSTLGASNLYAAGMHYQVSYITYTDFGQNMGRYRVSGVNDLLSSIRKEEGGVVITYKEGHDDYTLEHYMPSFESQGDNGAYAAIGYNYIATVQHNGCQNPIFTGRYIGDANSLRYYGVEYKDALDFCMVAQSPDKSATFDYKVTRLNRLVTDVMPSTPIERCDDGDIFSRLLGQMEYRSGSGTKSLWDLDGYKTGMGGAYSYATGGVRIITGGQNNNPTYGFFTTVGNMDYSEAGISESSPLPFAPDGGDSGSPVWIWDEASQSYLYMDAYQSIFGAGERSANARGAINYTWDSLERFDQDVAVNGSTVHIQGVVAREGDEVKEEYFYTTNEKGEKVLDHAYITKLHLGNVVDADGNVITDYVGVKGDGDEYINTWLNLAPEKDKATWFAYDNKYYNVGVYDKKQRELEIQNLFFTENLVFQSGSASGNTVVVDADTDLGIGYLQFKRAEGAPEGQTVAFTLQSAANNLGRNYMVNSAGFVVEKGVDLHVKLTNTERVDGDYYYREWRKVGDGDLYLEGQGDNGIFLNVGGSGTTYLKESGGFAAYNVYVGSGSTVVMDSTAQIARDFTFGYNGGTLDIRGNNTMDWYRTNPNVAAQGFSINSYSEDSYITNSLKGTTLELTYKQSGNTEYLGSFVDTVDGGAVRIRFDAGEGSTTTLRSIHTDLTHQKGEAASGSAVFVDSGKVVLEGSNTVHGRGSENGLNTNRYSSTEDWHYADMAGDVHVDCGAVFELGSHARLTGDVYVYTGGTLTIREGVLSTYEYIEGGQRLEDTTSAFYRQFYGLHGNIETDASTELRFEYSAGTTAEQVYTGNITGGAVIYMNLGGSGATLRLSGNNTLMGGLSLSGGGLISDNGLAALGAYEGLRSRWLMAEDSFIAANGATGDELLGMLSSDSQGMLALTQNQTTDLNLQQRGFSNLFVGALAGKTVHYGEAGKTLATTLEGGSPKWLLGGGGGNLIVDFLLDNKAAELVLGNGYTDGTVTLTNTRNSIGSITFSERVTLDYTEAAALGGADVTLDYGRRMQLAAAADVEHVTQGSQGAVLVDKLGGAVPDMRGHAGLYIGSAGSVALNAAPQIGAGATYRFGGITGTLIVNAELADVDNRPSGLSVDAQGYSGGVLELAKAASLTGDVVVRGYDADLLPAAEQRGDITLNLTCNNALADAASVTLLNGSALNLNGTSQTFHNLAAQAGTAISSADPGSSLTLVNSSQTEIAADMQFDSLVKQGDGRLILSGFNHVDSYDVLEGTLKSASVNSLYRGVVNVHEGATLGLANGTANVSVIVHDGAGLEVQHGETAALTKSFTFQGSATVCGSGTLNIGSSTQLGKDGSTLTIDDSTVLLTANGNFTQKGILRGEGNATLRILGGDKTHSYQRVLEHLDVADGATLTVQQDEVETNPTYEIHNITGSGELVLSAGGYKDSPSYYRLNRDTDFSGTFTFRAGTGYSSHKYMSYAVIQTDNALQNAQVQMYSWKSNSGYITLGVDTENARIQGLSTTNLEHTILMAGGTGSDTVNRPVSTRRATLTITGSDTKVYSGLVVGGANGTDHGLSIVMDGLGTQTFSGSSVFNDVSALRGTLKITATDDDTAINGDLTVARGASLTISKGYTLDAGKTIHVVGSTEHNPASLDAPLALSGGTIDFSGAAIGTDSYALMLDSVLSGSAVLAFSDTSYLHEGTYYLANGDWSNVALTCDVLDYLDVSLERSMFSLAATFSRKAGTYIWDGDSSNRAWTDTRFGRQTATFTETDSAVFTDAAQGKVVDVAYSGDIASFVFDSSDEYTVNANGGLVFASTLRHTGSGTTVVNGGVRAANIQLEAGELLVRDAALLAAATVSGNGTLGIDLGEGTSINLPTLGGDGIGALHLVSGTLNVTETLNVIREAFVEEKATLNASTATFLKSGVSLHLAGNLTLNLTGNLNTSITGIDGHVGTLALTGGSVTVDKTAALQVGTLDIRQDTMVVHRDGDSVREIGTLQLGNNTTFSQYSDTQPGTAMEIGSLVMTGGTATLKEENNSGALAIRSLSHSGSGSATLNLTNSATSTIIATFYLGGADENADDFTGTINLSSTNSGGNRSAAIILNDANVAAHAAVNLASAASSGALLGLGVNAERVEIAGLSSGNGLGNRARVFSGGLAVNTQTSDAALAGDDTVRELAITTAAGTDYSYHGRIGRNINLTIGGSGIQRFIGENLSADLNLVGGETVLDMSQYTGHATVGTGAELSFAGAHTVVSNLIETDGSIRFTGNNAVLELADDGDLAFNGFGYRDIDGNESPDVNGFALGGSVKLFNKGVGASINMGTSSLVYQGNTLVLGEDGIARLDAGDSYTYYVRKGRVTYDETFASKPSAAGITTFLLISAQAETPAELEIAEDLKDDILIHSIGNGGILRLGEGVSLSTASLDAQASTTLAGEGRLELAKGVIALPQGVGLGQDWTGSVAVSGISFTGGFSCAQLGTAQSWVELKGTKGYLNNNPTIANNLILAKGEGGWAFEQNNGNDGTTVKFTGKLKGDGNIGRSNETGSTYTYEFSGDIHEWTGSFISRNSNKKYTMFRVSGDATEVNANLLLGNPGATYNDLRLEVKNNARFNGRVEVNSITVDDGASATLAGNTSISKGIANSGTLTNVGTLELGNITSWSGTLVNAAQGNVVITSKLTAGTIDNSGTITISDLMIGSDATYTDAHGSSSSGNGFAISSFEVCANGVIQNQESGIILYNGRNVTQEVLETGGLQNVSNNAAYHITTTDDSVSFSQIVDASGGALQHIVFAADAALKVDNADGGEFLHSSQLAGTGTPTLQLQDGATAVLDSGRSIAARVDQGAQATLAIDAAANIVSVTTNGGLAITGDGTVALGTGSAASLIGSGTLAIDGLDVAVKGNNNAFTGNVSVGNATIVMSHNYALGQDNASTARTITINEGGAIDLNGCYDVLYAFTLNGGTLMNTGGDTGNTHKQTSKLILTDSSMLGGTGNFHIINNGYKATSVELNGHTLTKTGGNTVGFKTTTFDAGTLEVQGGKLEFNDGGKGANTFSKSAEMILNVNNSGDADRVSGQVNVVEGLALRAQQSAKASVAVSLSDKATLTTGAGANQTLNMIGAVSGSASTTLAKEGTGTAILTNTGSFRGSVEVKGGILNLMNAASVDVQDVTIAAGATMGVYSNTTAAEANEGTLTIKDTKTLTAGRNATLNANLVMESGSTLDVSATGGAGLLMGSSVTMSPGGVTLSEADLAAVANLGFMQAYDLFSGVDSFRIGETSYSEIALTGEWVNASEVFSNDLFQSGEKEYYVFYSGVQNGSNVGAVYVMLLPEPTTGTLSLLALAALAARRRRR